MNFVTCLSLLLVAAPASRDRKDNGVTGSRHREMAAQSSPAARRLSAVTRLARTAGLSIILMVVALSDTASADESFSTSVRPVLRKYCVRCHGPEQQSGDFRVDTLTANFDSAEQAAHWVEVMDNLNLGEMPPDDEPKPSADKLRNVTRWIAAELRAAERRTAGGGGRVALRRMNRVEFSSTIRDLLGIRFLPGDDPAELLPPDPTYDGFDKVATSLMLDSSLLGNYYEAAKKVAELAIVDGPPKFPTHLSHFEMEDMGKPGSGFSYVCSGTTVCGEHDVRLLVGNTRTHRGLLYPKTQQMFPVKGFYTIRVRASADRGDGDEPVRMFVERQQDRHGYLMEVDVTATRDAPKVYEVTLPMTSLAESSGVYMKVGIANGAKGVQQSQLKHIKGPEKVISVGMPGFFSFDKKMKEASTKGDHATALRLAARKKAEGWTGSRRPGLGLLEPSHFRKLYIDWIEIEGPLYEKWPPRSHTALFFKGEDAVENLDYAREMFARFLPRAFRRPVEDAEVERVVKLIGAELDRGLPFKDAVKLGLTYTLTSPSFLYLSEPAPDDESRTLTDYELASRLSYFLWSSMPDERLFKLARDGRLNNPKALRGEVDRMLEDPKSQALVDGFAAQWLQTEEFLDFQPDQKIYPQFYREHDPQLREFMAREPLAFFEEVARNDLSLLNFIDSDFVVVNEPLAKFYGLNMESFNGEPQTTAAGRDHSHSRLWLADKQSGRHHRFAFRRVELPKNSPRGGLLGQAGVHLRGSDGIRTKPVNRGVYVREVLFNDPPDPPPPNAGEVEPNIEGERLTVRQRLIQHQQIEACASCHRGIDSYGLALENFDVTGAWRERQNGEEFRGSNTPPVDASGTLPNGRTFSGFAEFKALLLEQDDRFRRAIAGKLFLYALGRPVDVRDRGTINVVTAKMSENGNTFRSAVQALVELQVFRTK
ncbi:MAG: DUF1592 domain-containing protein [Planctomycetota bacterium]